MLHKLKTHSEFFNAILRGDKEFEVRKDDRNFQRGDELFLEEYNDYTKSLTGRILHRRIKYILRGGQFGIKEGYCVMSLEKI
jgi:murein L,D-transpeptidase YafK